VTGGASGAEGAAPRQHRATAPGCSDRPRAVPPGIARQANTEELVAINTALHYLGQGELPLPLMLVGAGLPSLPAQLADATSYAERLYDYRPVGLLDRPAAVDALTIPTRALGVDWDDTALAMSADVAGGYPYFLQAIGKHVWDNAINSPISADDVGVGMRDARREVDDGLYRSRWERATPAQRDLLRAGRPSR
jgi:hypothetical protein